MTEQEYKQKKCECWEEFKRTNLDGEVQWQPVNRYDVFCAAFDRAYALGKQEKDADGEAMLTCEKSKAMQLYSHLLDLIENERMSEHYSEWCDLEREYIALFGENVFADYFGSKRLLDAREVNFATKKPQPAETKNEGTRQEQCVPKNAESGTHSFSHILKDSFRKERRLNIAAQIVASMIGSDDWTTWRGGSNKEIWHNMAKSSLEIADALIAEAEKGGIK